MAHPSQEEFCQEVKARFPEKFKGWILEAGAADINGNNNFLYGEDCCVVKVDVAPADNVNYVGFVHELGFVDGFFDVIVSTEMLEHDKYWEDSLRAMVRMLRARGLLLLTCAAGNRSVHGTREVDPGASLTSQIDELAGYYQTRSVEDLKKILGGAFIEEEYRVVGGVDLYYWGIKK